jgi:hypothetical protein
MDFTVEPRKRFFPKNPADISTLSAELSDDRRKVRVTVQLDRDDTNPDLDLLLSDHSGKEICHSTIIETIGSTIKFTLHIRIADVRFPLSLKCQLSYLNDTVHTEMEIMIPM